MSLKSDVKSIPDKNYFYLLAHLTAMPFHHLVSAESLLLALSSDSNNSDQLSIPSIYESPFERLKLFQNAAIYFEQKTSKENRHQKTSLDRFIQFVFTDNDPSGKKVEIAWQVIFNDELQGCAEIYKAEMMIFKRMLYEQEEILKSRIEFTNEIFPQHLNYKLFDELTGNETEKLLLNSLSANYQMSVTTLTNHSNKNNENNDEKISFQNKSKSKTNNSNSDGNLTVSTRRSYGWKSLENNENNNAMSAENNSTKTVGNYSRNEFKKNAAVLECSNKTISKDESSSIYKFNLSGYWSKWRQTARLVKFDFGLLETFEDTRVIRFYELSKLLRLASLREESQSLPAELRINYKQLTMMMPLPRFSTEDEIKEQVQYLTEPLEKVDYIKSLSINNFEKKTKNPMIVFQFGQI